MSIWVTPRTLAELNEFEQRTAAGGCGIRFTALGDDWLEATVPLDRRTAAADGGLHAFKVRTGEKVWSHVFCDGAINCTPVVSGDLVYCAHGDINPDNAAKQGRVICLDAGNVEKGEPKVVSSQLWMP